MFSQLIHSPADLLLIDLAGYIQIMEHFCCIQFRIIGIDPIYANLPLLLFEYQPAFYCQIHDMFLYQLLTYAQKLHRSCQKLHLRQIHMTFQRDPGQHMQNTAADPEIRIRMDPDF